MAMLVYQRVVSHLKHHTCPWIATSSICQPRYVENCTTLAQSTVSSKPVSTHSCPKKHPSFPGRNPSLPAATPGFAGQDHYCSICSIKNSNSSCWNPIFIKDASFRLTTSPICLLGKQPVKTSSTCSAPGKRNACTVLLTSLVSLLKRNFVVHLFRLEVGVQHQCLKIPGFFVTSSVIKC